MFEFAHIHQISANSFSTFKKEYRPVFVLNTGRSGSAFIKTLLMNFKDVSSHHEAFPNLFLQSNYAFHNQDKEEVLAKIFESSRMELLLESFVKNEIYVESNQCLVFYINQIISIFPNAKFVHLVRHPGDFVTSAIKKGWHKNDSVWELGRIKTKNEEKWKLLSHTQKLSWVWNETHAFIEEFKSQNKSSVLTLKFEDLVNSTDEVLKLLKFTGINNMYSKKYLKKLISKKVNEVNVAKGEPNNMFKLDYYPKYTSWTNVQKKELISITDSLSDRYNYKL